MQSSGQSQSSSNNDFVDREITKSIASMNINSGNSHASNESGNESQKQNKSKSNLYPESNHRLMKERASSFQDPNLFTDYVHYDRKESKGNKRKGKKGIKWNKPEGYKDLLGFNKVGPSPFDFESGYDINDIDLIHFKQRPVRGKVHKNSNYSASQHVQANHRFILKPNREQDYFFLTYDPDYEIKWDDLFMVHAKRNTDYMCPICREEVMVAPTINK